jgi:branched-chain amino acid aminotransferase
MEVSYQRFWIKNDQVMEQQKLPADFIEHGTSLYEVLRVMQGIPLFLEQHLARLKHTAQLTGLALPLDDAGIQQRLHDLMVSNKVDAGNVKLVINYPSPGGTADLYAYFVEHSYPSASDYQNGIKTVLVQVERPNPNAKVDRADYRRTVDGAIRESGAYEALLVDRQGNVSEGGRSNLFMLKGDIIYTAPGDKVLKGITRQMVFAACHNRGYQVVEKEISLQEMLNMEAIFISGTSPKVLPVSQVDDQRIDSGSNAIIRDIMAGYDAIINEYIDSHQAK